MGQGGDEGVTLREPIIVSGTSLVGSNVYLLFLSLNHLFLD